MALSRRQRAWVALTTTGACPKDNAPSSVFSSDAESQSTTALNRLLSTRPWRLAVVDPDGRRVQLEDEPPRQHLWRRAYQSALVKQISAACDAARYNLRIR